MKRNLIAAAVAVLGFAANAAIAEPAADVRRRSHPAERAGSDVVPG